MAATAPNSIFKDATGALLKFHHLGLAVKQPAPAAAFVAGPGYQSGAVIFDPGQNIFAQFCTHPQQPAIEILWPGDTKSPIDELVKRHANGILYHICYETDDLAKALGELEAAGSRAVCISPPKLAPLFGNRNVSFYNVIGMGLIEILSPNELDRGPVTTSSVGKTAS